MCPVERNLTPEQSEKRPDWFGSLFGTLKESKTDQTPPQEDSQSESAGRSQEWSEGDLLIQILTLLDTSGPQTLEVLSKKTDLDAIEIGQTLQPMRKASLITLSPDGTVDVTGSGRELARLGRTESS